MQLACAASTAGKLHRSFAANSAAQDDNQGKATQFPKLL